MFTPLLKRVAPIWFCLSVWQPSMAEPTIEFGIVPQQPVAKVAQLWGPFVQYIASRSGVNIRFRTAKDIPTFETEMSAGVYDVVYCNPYQYVVHQRRVGFNAFAKEKGRKLTGIIVVQKGRDLKTLADLRNTTLVFPAPNAFASSMIPRAILKSRGIVFDSKYVNNHESVYRAVAEGHYPAGGGISATFNELSPIVRSKLEIFWTSDGYTPHAFAAHPRVPKDIIEKLKSVMVQMAHDPRGAVILERLSMTGFEVASDAQWNDVRAIESLVR